MAGPGPSDAGSTVQPAAPRAGVARASGPDLRPDTPPMLGGAAEPASTALRRWFSPLASSTDRLWYAVSAVLVLSGLVHLLVFALGDRPWAGPVSWRKPATFGLSFGITLATVTWVTTYLVMSARRRRRLLTVLAVDCIVEVTGITVQAWRDVPSHLNTSTPVDAAIAYTLAVGGAVLVVVLGTFAAYAVAGRTAAPGEMRTALRWGFIHLLAGCAAGAAMIAYGTEIMRTASPELAYQVTGFLKGFHAVALHGVLVLPALAVLVGRMDVTRSRRMRIVRGGTSVYTVAALVVLAYDIATTFG